MQVTDSGKARLALTLLGAVFLAEAGFMLLDLGVITLTSKLHVYNLGAWFTGVQVFWLLAASAELWAFFELSRAVKPAWPAQVLAIGAALLTTSSLYWLVVTLTSNDELLHTPAAVRGALIAIGGLEAIGTCVVVGRLGRTTAFAAAVGVFGAVRSLSSLALALRSREAEPPPSWTYDVHTVVAIITLAGIGALALHARGIVARDGGLLQQPVTSPILEASGMRQVIVGVALLMLGIGVTVASYAAASSGEGGGRYVVATGAIATGVVQLARGLSRLGRRS